MASSTLWRRCTASGLSSAEAFARQHRLNHIPLRGPGGPQGFPSVGAAGAPAGGPQGFPSVGAAAGGAPQDPRVPPGDQIRDKPERSMKHFVWEEGPDGLVREPRELPGIGSASGASGSPLAAAATVGGAAASAAAAVRRAVAATPLWPLLIKGEIAARCAFNALTKPTEDFHIATLSEMFAEPQLERMRQYMMYARV